MMRQACLLLLSLSLLSCASAQVFYNAANTAGCAEGCLFTDPAIWEGGIAPNASDDIIVDGASDITLVINGVQQYASISISDTTTNVTLWVTNNATLALSSQINATTALLKIDSNSSFFGNATANLGSLIVSSGTISGKTISVSLASTFANALVNATALLCESVTSSDSIYWTNAIGVSYLYSSGSDKFLLSPPSIYVFASFSNNPYLLLGGGPHDDAMVVSDPNVRIEIHDCVSNITALYGFSTNLTVSYTTTSPSPSPSPHTAFLGTISADFMTVELHDNVQFTLNFGQANYSVANDVILNLGNSTVPNPAQKYVEVFDIVPIGQPTGPLTINVGGLVALDTPSSPLLNANINIGQGGELLVNGDIQVGPAGSNDCGIFGPLGVLIVGASLRCDGILVVGEVLFPTDVTPSGALNVGALFSNVTTLGSGTIDAATVKAYNTFLSSPLTVNGNFTQVNGDFEVSISSIATLPPAYLQASGDIIISKSALIVDLNIVGGLNFTLALAKSLSGSVNAEFANITATAQNFTVSPRIDNNNQLSLVYTFITTPPGKEPSQPFLEKYKYALIGAGGALALLVVFVVVFVVMKRRRRVKYQPLY